MTKRQVLNELHKVSLYLAQAHKLLQDTVEQLDMSSGDDVILCLELGQALDHTGEELDYVRKVHKQLGQDLGVIPKDTTL